YRGIGLRRLMALALPLEEVAAQHQRQEVHGIEGQSARDRRFLARHVVARATGDGLPQAAFECSRSVCHHTLQAGRPIPCASMASNIAVTIVLSRSVSSGRHTSNRSTTRVSPLPFHASCSIVSSKT